MTLRLRRGTNLERQSVVFQEGELVYVTDTKALYVGDGTTLGGVAAGGGGGGPLGGQLQSNLDLNGYEINGFGDINIDGTINATNWGNISLLSLIDVGINFPINGDVLSYFEGQFINVSLENALTGLNINLNILGSDSSVFVDSSLRIVYGDIVGGVFGFDESLLIDPISNKGTFANVETSQVSFNQFINFNNLVSDTPGEFRVNTFNERSVIRLNRESDTVIPISEPYGAIFFGKTDSDRDVASNLMFGFGNKTIYTIDTTETYSESTFITFFDGGLIGLGTVTPTERIDVVGNGKFTGSVTAENFISTGTGTPTLESATNLDLQAVNAVRVIGAPFRLANLTTIERDALIASNGDLIYNTTDNKIQGYQNGAWINLDDGTLA